MPKIVIVRLRGTPDPGTIQLMVTRNDLGSNELAVKDGLVYVKLVGRQDKELAERMLTRFKELVAELRQKQGKVYVFVDYHALAKDDVTVEARLAIKEAFGQPFTALAAYGNNRLAEIALYLIQAGGARQRARHFTSEKKARQWLHEQEHPKPERGSYLPIAAAITGILGLLAIIGWVNDTRWLMGLSENLRPINPLGAIGLLVTSLTLAALWYRRWRLVYSGGFLLVLIGLAALLPVPADQILFGDKLRTLGDHTALADLAGVCFIGLGLGLCTARRTDPVSVRARIALGIIIIGISTFNAFGLLYAREFVYGVSDTFAMAFNLACGLGFAGGAFISMWVLDKYGNVIARITRLSWLLVAVLLLVQIVTYASWEQSINRNRADAARAFEVRSKELNSELKARVQAYIDGLYGFRGLFAASNDVSERDFNAFYENLRLDEKYPGIRAISYISLVRQPELQAFVAQRRADDSVSPESRNFTLQRVADGTEHYFVTYLTNGVSRAAMGLDLKDDKVRYATYQQAMQTGQPAVSDTIEFTNTAGQAPGKGFFITIPIPWHEGQSVRGNGQYIGFVSALFTYEAFFENAFTSPELLKNLDTTVADTRSGSTLFMNDAVKGQETKLSYSEQLPIADRTWTMSVMAASNFNNSTGQSLLPRSILFGGQAISLLLAAVFLMQNRGRARALKLADDITADLQHERNEAIAIRQKDEAILSSIGDAVFAIAPNQTITLFNPAAEHVSGYTAEEAIGKPYHKILSFRFAADDTPNDGFIKKALNGQLANMQQHTVLIHKNGKRIPVADSAAPIHDLSGTIIGAIVVFRDISTEYELDRAKTEFVSLASHQLRTPLSAINWYAEMLLDGDAGKISTAQKEYLQEIYEGNQRMIELVNSLLDVSRLDLGKLTNEPSENDAAALIASLEKELATSIQSKKLQLKNNIAPDLAPVIADPKLLRMIVQNLLSNAVKYTGAAGTVTVTARPATATDVKTAKLKGAAAGYLFLSVQDNGYGIPASQQSKIFSKLFRADNVRALDVEGTGLGLYIVREVVEKLGGHVWFESHENKGTTFFVVIPFTTKAAGKSST